MSSLPLNDRQFAFWRLRCTGLPNVGTANRFSISRQAVSGAACIPGGHVMSIMKTIRAYLGWCPVQGAMRTSLPVRPGIAAGHDCDTGWAGGHRPPESGPGGGAATTTRR